MKTTILISVIALLYWGTTAQELSVPSVLTCNKVNYTYTLRDGQWNSMGKYWMSAKWGDNKSFYTSQNNPFVLLRVNYGAPPGEASTNAVIYPTDQICSTENGYSLSSIYVYFQLNGTYEGKETINGVLCNRWYAEIGQIRPSKYLLWVTDPIGGVSMPIRHIAIENTHNSDFPIQTTMMDFLSGCQPTDPPPFTFTMPTYCPIVHVPVAASPRVVWRPPAPAQAEDEVEHAPRVIWKPPPPPEISVN